MARSTPVSSVIKDLELTDVSVGELARDRGAIHKDLYAKLLLACEGDQVQFLIELYENLHPDDEMKIVFLSLVKNGFFVDLLNPDDLNAHDLIRAVQFGMMTLKTYLGSQPHVCSRCKRRRV